MLNATFNLCACDRQGKRWNFVMLPFALCARKCFTSPKNHRLNVNPEKCYLYLNLSLSKADPETLSTCTQSMLPIHCRYSRVLSCKIWSCTISAFPSKQCLRRRLPRGWRQIGFSCFGKLSASFSTLHQHPGTLPYTIGILKQKGSSDKNVGTSRPNPRCGRLVDTPIYHNVQA